MRPPAKRVGGVEPPRGFESRTLRHYFVSLRSGIHRHQTQSAVLDEVAFITHGFYNPRSCWSEPARPVPVPFSNFAMLSIAVVIATYNRPELLASRALPSVARQTRPPDRLIVVDDSDGDVRRANACVVAGFKAASAETRYIVNNRTPGASGAWNTALVHLKVADPETFVAILDDDDAWDPTYLEQCERVASDQNLDMVAASLIYRQTGASNGVLLDSPLGLDADEMLVRSTHIQGSNLFVKLRKLLEAGGFDEALVSTTDRDVCIRLADLGTVRYGAIAEHLVHHYADNDRPRLSTPGGDKKKQGLRYFFRKYQSRMSASQKEAFIQRSVQLFDCDPTAEDLP